jgi:transcriptional regulator with PAS, ATPase and Fis domain
MRTLVTLPWKGNVRELDNVIEHAMIVGTGDWISSSDLPRRISEIDETELGCVTDDLKSAMRIYERSHIGTVMRRTPDDKKRAAELLGISLSSLYRKIEELDLN